MNRTHLLPLTALLGFSLAVACGGSSGGGTANEDAGPSDDAGPGKGGKDAGSKDGGHKDSGPQQGDDAGFDDGGESDGAESDGAEFDGSEFDGEPADGEAADGGEPEAGPPEAGTGSGFRAISLFDDEERVTGIYCTSATACVVSTDQGDDGHIYATNGKKITSTVVTGNEAFGEALGVLGGVEFLGFSKIGTKLVAHMEDAEDGFVTATGDITVKANWTSELIASNTDDFGGNATFGYASHGGTWTIMAEGRIWNTTDAPGPSATWTNIYSPQATDPIPENIEDERATDPTLCDTDPSVSIAPDLVQPVYIAPDLSVIITPAGAVNQAGNDTAGVCISVDGGMTFHHSAFAGVPIGSGPNGIDCTTSDHCIAYGGDIDTPKSSYIYISTDATMGAKSHWTPATTPALPADTQLRCAAFAPDGTHGWIVGADSSNNALMFTSTDGGATWKNATSMIASLASDGSLHSVYAFDATHVWVGGDEDILLTTGD